MKQFPPDEEVHPSPQFWSLRDEIYRFTHQWPLVLLAILLGCLAGWGSQYIWPSYHQATVEVYVALNPYRTFSDATFLALARPKYSNIDDFKNWQMSQLETVLFTDAFIQETLEKLRQQDSIWMAIEADDLRDMLEADWRSAGTWSLIAQHADPKRAKEAVEAWSSVSVARVRGAILAAQDTFQIDQELDTAAEMSLQAQTHRNTLQNASTALLAWQESAAELPQGAPLEPAERWRVLALVTPAADFSPAWMALLQAQPEPSALPAAYRAWIDQVLVNIAAENEQLDAQIEQLEEKRENLAAHYRAASQNSLGISPNLEIQEMRSLPLKTIRPKGMLIMLGGVIGLLAWIFIQLGRSGSARSKELPQETKP